MKVVGKINTWYINYIKVFMVYLVPGVCLLSRERSLCKEYLVAVNSTSTIIVVILWCGTNSVIIHIYNTTDRR